jgi:hypothetical protein
MIALLCFFLILFASPFKSKSRLEAENAALRHQLIVVQRKMRGRVCPPHERRPLVPGPAVSMVSTGPQGLHYHPARDPMGTFYRSKHELVFVWESGTAPHINTFELGQYGHLRSRQRAKARAIRAKRRKLQSIDDFRRHM